MIFIYYWFNYSYLHYYDNKGVEKYFKNFENFTIVTLIKEGSFISIIQYEN